MSIIQINLSSELVIKDLPCSIRVAAVRDLTLPNPEYVMRKRLGKRMGGIPIWFDSNPNTSRCPSGWKTKNEQHKKEA